MNFFAAQDRARKKTGWLILLFIFAVIGLILLTNLLLLGIFTYTQTDQFEFSPTALQGHYSWEVFAAVSIGVCLLIFGGSLYKTMSLSGGGSSVAEMLGGQLVPQASNDLQKQQLLNVVEEMAIAAGMPIPKVYLLEDTSINAFAAGNSPANAVIGVTRGTLSRLSREELQGVIAHEFSHIVNGDMRLNIRLIGILHGILLIGMIGYFILRSLRFTGRSNKKGGGVAPILALGLGLMVIGYAGTFFGNWIKASVSRQREYLADSSAVQFTRDREGIANALKKIGGSVGSTLESANAPQYSHAYFADGIGSFWLSLFSTHPPLERRIKQIQPSWDGKFLTSTITQTPPVEPEKVKTFEAEKIAVIATVLNSAEQAISQIGSLNEENIEYVHQLILAMPPTLRIAAQDAYTARALIYSILIQLQRDKKTASSTLSRHTDADMLAQSEKLLPELGRLDDKFKLPLLELGINALRELSPNQFVQFKIAVDKIIASDKTVNLNEWVIQRLVIQQLDLHFGFRKPAKTKHASLNAVKPDLQILLSLIAYVEHKDDSEAKFAFDKGARESGIVLEILPRQGFSLKKLDHSLDSLMQLKPLAKPRLLKACVAIVLHDDQTTTRGIELVRTISTCLDCPMPPMAT